MPSNAVTWIVLGIWVEIVAGEVERGWKWARAVVKQG